MDDDHLDEPPEALDLGENEDEDARWGGVAARRGPRPHAEGVRIIGADEAAAAIESGHVAAKKPEDELRFGDVPPQPSGPRPSIRFPGDDPSAVAKPPVSTPAPSERESPAAEAARRWDEALARSSESRSRYRSTSSVYSGSGAGSYGGTGEAGVSGGSDSGSGGSGDLFGYGGAGGGGSTTASSAPPPPPPPPAGPYGDDDYGDGGYASTGNWLDEEPDLLAPQPPPPPSYEQAPMQHWTEPPSGEVPRILIDDDEELPEDDLSAWGSLGARPRWRDQPADWEEADFNEDILVDEGHRIGALRTDQGEAAPFSFDDEPEPEPPPVPAGYERRTVSGNGAPTGGRTRISTLPTGSGPMPPGGGRRGAGAGAGGGGRRGGGDSRDVSTRVVTGAIAGGVVLLAAAIGPGALVFLVAVALTMASAEMYHGLRTRGYHPATLLGLVGAPALVGAVYWKGLDAYPLVISLFVVFTLLWYLLGVVKAKPAMNVAVTLMAFLYIAFLGSFAALMLKAGSPGIRILVGAILATVAYDVGAYFGGRSMGRTPLAPAISPGKTVEGAVAATIVTLITCLVIVRAIDPWDGGKAFWLAIAVSIAAPLGDLCESMLKRDLGVKDMGNILPGHGGVLDRIDALLFVIPATYYLVRLVF